MRIAFIGQKGIPATYGGIENFVENISLRLAKKGHKVVVFCRPHYTSVDGLYKGVLLKRIKSIKSKHLDALSHTFLSTLSSLNTKFDIICYQALGPSSLCFMPRLSGSAKVVTIIHSLDWKRKKWGRIAQTALKLAEYPSVMFPHKVVVVSEELKEYLEKKTKKRVERITPGIEVALLRPPERIKKFGLEKEKFILFLGRLVPEKGCHFLVEAFSNLSLDAYTKKDFKLFIAGDGCFSDDYIKKLHEYKKSFSDNGKKIIFGGYVDQQLKEELFSNAYLFVLPSEIEGIPQTILEALSYGKCVLASDIPENKNVVKELGYTFKNKNPKDLKEKLEYLLSDEKLVNSKNKERVNYIKSNFSWDKTTDDLENLFLDCLSFNKKRKVK